MPRIKKSNSGKTEEHHGFQNFNLVRRITRELFVNGFRNHKDYVQLSPSTFYSRISLITNCLASCMEWPEQGYSWISNDKMRIMQNPLYVLFKARPMKNLYQYALHFAIMDMFSNEQCLSLAEISKLLADVYGISEDAEQKNKLQPRLEKYYIPSGLLSKDENKKYLLSPIRMNSTESTTGLLTYIPGLESAIAFFSEYSPLGIIGSYIMDTSKIKNNCFVFKHVYLSQVLDAQVLYIILNAIYVGRFLKISVEHTSDTVLDIDCFLPLKVFSGTWTGRQYVFGYDVLREEYKSLRIDYIERAVELLSMDILDVETIDRIKTEGDKRISTIWSSTSRKQAYHVKVVFSYNKPYLYEQISRERRKGTLTSYDNDTIVYECDVDEPKEMINWLLSHIGMISSIAVSGGKTKSDNRKLLNRFQKHILDMQRVYNMETIPAPPLRKGYEPIDNVQWRRLNSGEDKADLFHHIFSSYLLRLQDILEAAMIPKTKKELENIIKTICDDSLSDINTVISFHELLNSGMLVQTEESAEGLEKYRSFVSDPNSAVIKRPLTKIEKSWLLAILDDRMISLFISPENVLKAKTLLSGVTSLYSPDDILYFDQYLDGDDIANLKFQENFRLLQKAITDGYRRVLVKYQSENEKKKKQDGYIYELVPIMIEYSKLNNRFWLLCNIYNSPEKAPLVERESSLVSLKMSNIIHVELLPKETASPRYGDAFEQVFEEEFCKIPILLRLNDYGNALERFMIAFSPYKKETSYDDKKNECIVKLWYSKNDKKEVLLKLRSFGEAVEILAPQRIRADMVRRIDKQIKMMSMV